MLIRSGLPRKDAERDDQATESQGKIMTRLAGCLAGRAHVCVAIIQSHDAEQ